MVTEDQRARLELMRAAARRDEALRAARRTHGKREVAIALAVLALVPVVCGYGMSIDSQRIVVAAMLGASGGLAGMFHGVTLWATGRAPSEQPEPWNVLVPLAGLLIMIAAPVLLMLAWFSFD